jgi:hypothetical protein
MTPSTTERVQPRAISPWVRDRRAPGLGPHVKKWIETNLVYAEGDSLGDPWQVDGLAVRGHRRAALPADA